MPSTSKPLASPIRTLVGEIADQLVQIRRTLHANPELGFQETETAALISGHLEQCGIHHRCGIARTGIAAIVGNGPGPVVALRGDMDALPITEATDLPFASRRPGAMHACGHDAHAAITLGVAMVLSRLAEDLPGRVMIVFQPAEEALSGAAAMLADGLFDPLTPDVVLGFHNWPLLPAGTVGWHPDVAFASSDAFDVVIKGASGHGAHPHLAVDPIVAAAHLISELQMIVSRETAPLASAVVTIGKIQGGTVRNQIPDEVRLEGTIRTLAPETRSLVVAAVKRVAEGVALSHRVDCAVTFLTGVAAVRNDPRVLDVLVDAARGSLGADHVVQLPQGSMGSEDFAEFSTRIPSAHLRIGSALEGRNTMLHRSDFDLDERCIPVAVEVLASAALMLMARP